MSTPGADGDLTSQLHQEYALLAERVAQQREQVERLRALTDQIAERTAADEHLLTEMSAALGLAAQLRIDELSPRLRGQRLQEVALQVLQAERGLGQEIHYRDWFELVERRGHRVGGKDPLATFLAQVHRAPGVEARGRRSGRYQLRHGVLTD